MFYIIVFLLFVLLLFLGSFWNAPWLPTHEKDFERIASFVKRYPILNFYDLGSGSGDLLFYLSKQYDIKCVGIEISPVLYLYSKIKSIFYKNVTIEYGNFFNYNLKEADAVYCFIKPEAYPKLKEKLKKELKKETIIILSCWPFEENKLFKISKLEGGINFYIYRKKDI